MLRLAQPQDVPQLTAMMRALKPQTAWAQVEGGTDDSLPRFLDARLADPRSVCYVWDDGGGRLSAFCGAALSQFYLPPYMPCMHEWGWSGSKREAVHCWVACKSWAYKHGALWAGRVRPQPGVSSRRVVEQMVWEKL